MLQFQNLKKKFSAFCMKSFKGRKRIKTKKNYSRIEVDKKDRNMCGTD